MSPPAIPALGQRALRVLLTKRRASASPLSCCAPLAISRLKFCGPANPTLGHRTGTWASEPGVGPRTAFVEPVAHGPVQRPLGFQSRHPEGDLRDCAANEFFTNTRRGTRTGGPHASRSA